MVRYDLFLSLLAAVAGVVAKPETQSGSVPGAFMFEFEDGAVSARCHCLPLQLQY